MTNTIKEYSKIEAGIAELTKEYSDVKDCSTDAGLKACKKDYKEVRSFEIKLDKKRKDLGEEARKRLDAINSEAKSIDARLKEISAPHKEAYEAREAEIKAAEEKRVNDIREQINGITVFLTQAESADSESITGIIEAVDMIDVSEHFEEFTQEALKTKQDVIARLGEMLQGKLQQEETERARIQQEEMQAKLDKQAAEQEEERKKQQEAIDKANAITERINNLRMIPVNMMGKPANEIGAKLSAMEAFEPTALEFGNKLPEVTAAMTQVIDQLKAMHTQQLLVEQAQQLAPEPDEDPVNMGVAVTEEMAVKHLTPDTPAALHGASVQVFVNDFGNYTIADLVGALSTEAHAAFEITFRAV